jgi:hypothetical protein
MVRVPKPAIEPSAIKLKGSKAGHAGMSMATGVSQHLPGDRSRGRTLGEGHGPVDVVKN